MENEIEKHEHLKILLPNQSSNDNLTISKYFYQNNKVQWCSNIFNYKKRLILLPIFIIILINLNSSFIWSRYNKDMIMVHHQSHVPGMKEMTGTDISNINISMKSQFPTLASLYFDANENSITKLDTSTPNTVNLKPPSGFLVWSDQCQIPNIPYDPDVMKYFKREKYVNCSSSEPLTNIQFDEVSKTYHLVINEKIKGILAKNKKLDCCYRNIERSGTMENVDSSYKLNKCNYFNKSFALLPETEFILVNCSVNKNSIYKNAHSMIPELKEVSKRINSWLPENKTRPLSVLLIGIDSISRQNLIRAMPKTAQHLYNSEWFELAGYNKIDDNTFPNLMALLTGYNQSTAQKSCNPKTFGEIDKCPFIWKSYSKYGYATAYAEDEASINTFNYNKIGFNQKPTDHYFRPFLLAAEKHLPIKKKSGLTYCLGYQHSSDYIYDYALKLSTTYKDFPYFGLFWTNTFSHSTISGPSSMDDNIVLYLKKLYDNGVNNNSMIIFFSDHGMRYGPTRRLKSGRFEERLPFCFIWLPDWFKEVYPEFVLALNINKNRLTTPYDIHITLKHILELSGRVKGKVSSTTVDCASCQTLFKPVPYNRTCENAGIEDHWCTCIPFNSINKDLNIVKEATQFSLDYINNLIRNYHNTTKYSKMCEFLTIRKIIRASQAISLNSMDDKQERYQVSFQTKPGQGEFEATVRYDILSKKFVLTGSISRTTPYYSESKCVPESQIKKYCLCTNKKTRQ